MNVVLQSLRIDAQAPLAGALRNLAPGQVLRATLTGMNGDGTGQLKLADGTVFRSALPSGAGTAGGAPAGSLPIGSRLQLQVEAGRQNAPVLKLIGVELPASATRPDVAAQPQAPAGHAPRASHALPRFDLAATGHQQAQAEVAMRAADARALSTAANAYADAGRELSPTQQQAGQVASADDLTLRFAIAFAGEQRQVDVHVEHEPEETDAEGAERDAWQLRFHMDFAETGPTEARISLQGGRLNLSLWAERPELAGALRQHLDELRGALAESGIAAGSLSVHDGHPGASLGAGGRIIGG